MHVKTKELGPVGGVRRHAPLPDPPMVTISIILLSQFMFRVSASKFALMDYDEFMSIRLHRYVYIF